MKKFVMVFAVAVLSIFIFVGMAKASSMFGVADPNAKAGNFQLGVGYFFNNFDWKGSDVSKFGIQQNQAYAEGAYTLMPGTEIYARLGGADLKTKDVDFFGATPNYSDGMKVYTGIGIRGTIYKFNPQFSIGANLYGDYVWQNYKDSSAGSFMGFNGSSTSEVKNMWTVNLLVAAQFSPNKFATIYIGPKFYYGQFTGDITAGDYSHGRFSSVSQSGTFHPNTWIGGVVGINFVAPSISDKINFGVETSYSDEWSIGGKISYRF